MNFDIKTVLDKTEFTKEEIVFLLKTQGEEKKLLYEKSAAIKEKYVQKITYFRGLIEFSNVCTKNCDYCGIRVGNKNVERYTISEDEILEAAKFAYDNKYGSVVLQSGEVKSQQFTDWICTILEKIKLLSNGELGITLSLGEQSEETYRKWFAAGGHRYLLRIETSNPDLYAKIHPNDKNHSWQTRLDCLHLLRKLGYQVGTGVMIGFPFQTMGDMADDLLFMKAMNIDMVGMGPYIEHTDTPLYQYAHTLMPKEERFELALKMIAVLRVMMKDINIAAATALQAIDKIGREKALRIGANIIMPNITPGQYRDDYQLYENKPCTDENASDCKNCLEVRIGISGDTIGYGEWGDSKHFSSKKNEIL